MANLLTYVVLASDLPGGAYQMAAPYVIAGFTSAPYTCRAFYSLTPQVVPATTVSVLFNDTILAFTVARCGLHFILPSMCSPKI